MGNGESVPQGGSFTCKKVVGDLCLALLSNLHIKVQSAKTKTMATHYTHPLTLT